MSEWIFNKWSGIGLGALLYGVVPVKMLPPTNIKLMKEKKRFDHFYGFDRHDWVYGFSEDVKVFWINMREFGECIKG